MGASDRSSIRFGAYELDLAAGVLRKNGTRIRCQEQPLQVLAALSESPGELVTREELRRRVWPRDTFVDFDHALNTAIKKVRAALNDDADAPRYIETVPRRGYRFVAVIEDPLEQKFEQKATSSHGLPPAARANHHRLLAMAGIAVILVVMLGVVWKFAPWHGDASTSPEFRRLTFEVSELGAARFTPDGASLVYSAAWQPNKTDIYEQRLDVPGPQQLGFSNERLLAVSPQAELAVLGQGSDSSTNFAHRQVVGTLASVPFSGGAPRELLPQVEAADWSPTGQLAVVRRMGNKSRLEFPIGKVLYESNGWIATPRFSRKGDSIAFVDHPGPLDDRGSVAIVDLNGKKTKASEFWESVRGLAWNPRGDEVWFAAARSGVSRALYAVNLSGRERRVLSVAGGLSLHDISRDGRVLLSRDNERMGIVFMGAGETEARELSWKDWSMVMDISPDGKQILFGEEGEDSGPTYQVGLRATDGSGVVILGSGGAQSLSPDGKWALSLMPAPNEELVLLPTGVGSSRTLERGGIERYQFAGARWFPDSSQIVFAAYTAGHGPRCYVQSIEGGEPIAFTPDGVDACRVSPSGGILAITEDSRALLYHSHSSKQPDKELKFEKGDEPIAWSPDGKFLYLVQTQREPRTIARFEIASGRRLPWKQLPPPPARSAIKSEHVVITPDGQSLAYTYSSHSSDLYLVLGLK
jgi:DNA-binding winged helix-turn-helix (wHTH) protein/Tol biopolymer transport system component